MLILLHEIKHIEQCNNCDNGFVEVGSTNVLHLFSLGQLRGIPAFTFFHQAS